jgi:hypothetical protein
MTGSGPASRRDRLREAQVALAARVTLPVAALAAALVFSPTGASAPIGGAALAVGAVGSAALMVAVWASLAPVVLQALALSGSPAVALPRERISAYRAIRRPQEPGRPGRARPRAPGAGPRPRSAA